LNTPAPAFQPIEDRTLRAQVKRQFLDQILAGTFLPGEKLVETALSAQLRVSRAPLREALRELVDQGILTSEPYKGFRVRPVSERDLKELYAMRTGLEKFAFTLAWPNRNEPNMADLSERYDRLMSIRSNGEQAQAIEREIAFHGWVYETTGNALLNEHWSRLAQLVRLYMSLHHSVHGFHGVFGEMTTDYCRLALGDDLDLMLEHIDEHMKQGLDTVLSAIPVDPNA